MLDQSHPPWERVQRMNVGVSPRTFYSPYRFTYAFPLKRRSRYSIEPSVSVRVGITDAASCAASSSRPSTYVMRVGLESQRSASSTRRLSDETGMPNPRIALTNLSALGILSARVTRAPIGDCPSPISLSSGEHMRKTPEAAGVSLPVERTLFVALIPASLNTSPSASASKHGPSGTAASMGPPPQTKELAHMLP